MLEEAKLARHLAFELAYSMTRIAPQEKDLRLRLLGHDLADIRQGAWQGLGRVGSVELIAELHQQLKDSDRSWYEKLKGNQNPFFRHAVYQAIDHILLRLEFDLAEGVKSVKSKKELEKLKDLASEASGTLCDHQGRPEAQRICRRVEWTIAQLEAHKPLEASSEH